MKTESEDSDYYALAYYSMSSPKRVFGISLEFLRRRGQMRQGVPVVLLQMVEFLDQYGLHQSELFHASRSEARRNELKKSLNRGEFQCFRSSDAHAVASLLILFLRELPYGLIPCWNATRFLRVYTKSTPISVTGEKGGNVTLTCECEANEILDIILSSRSENIPVCQNEECSGRVFKKGNCHIIIKDLRLNDAGKYFVNVYYRNNETELERQIRTYQLHIDDEISVKIGEELKLDVLLPDVDKVEHQSRRSTEWMEVWRSGNGVQSERMIISDRNLIISNFTARDAGTYRVLEPGKEILITVKVRVSKEKLDDTDKGKTDDTKYYRAPPVGTATIPVSGQKGSNVTLPCQFKARKISDISLNSRSENIPVCQTEECSGRVFKQGNCDVIIKDLSFSDAGTYFLRVYYNNDQTKLKQQFRTYQLHIYDEISVKTGEEHKLDVLSNANQVVHWAKNKTRWRELWSKSNGAQSDQLTDSDGTLTIKEFTDNDAGTYRVLDNEGEILITVTVRASDTKSKGKRYTNDDKTDDTQQHNEISVKIGEELKMDVLLPNADKVQHQSRGSTEWKEVWKRSGGVQSDLTTNTDGNLIIRKFMADDAGTYRVLDFERNILITVTVTVSGTESKGKLNYMDADKPNVLPKSQDKNI
ncbi:hypothetical protein ROHU_001926 [Labeo rohita]|uniref:Rho-GAP domain-containing protein n=1 Tax=Labeo rohita TaxID=84645 RepID=A0A498P0W2_LABRO|nr:hypothetical protein ROHU_001926 [Labeo rohita]